MSVWYESMARQTTIQLTHAMETMKYAERNQALTGNSPRSKPHMTKIKMMATGMFMSNKVCSTCL